MSFSFTPRTLSLKPYALGLTRCARGVLACVVAVAIAALNARGVVLCPVALRPLPYVIHPKP